jgi:hypothetical protein
MNDYKAKLLKYLEDEFDERVEEQKVLLGVNDEFTRGWNDGKIDLLGELIENLDKYYPNEKE